jgi:hypothetical protein
MTSRDTVTTSRFARPHLIPDYCIDPRRVVQEARRFHRLKSRPQIPSRHDENM